MRRMRFLRLDRGWTHKDLARASRVNRSIICNIENSRIVGRSDELDRIARALDCPPDKLFDHVSDTLLPDGAEARDSARERAAK